MRIVLLLVFSFSLPTFASIDSTRLQMELDYLVEQARDLELSNIEPTKTKEITTTNLKFKRSKNQTNILSLEDEFDIVRTKYSAPKRTNTDFNEAKDKFIDSEQERKPVRMNGLVPKGLFKE